MFFLNVFLCSANCLFMIKPVWCRINSISNHCMFTSCSSIIYLSSSWSVFRLWFCWVFKKKCSPLMSCTLFLPIDNYLTLIWKVFLKSGLTSQNVSNELMKIVKNVPQWSQDTLCLLTFVLYCIHENCWLKWL